MTRLQKYLLFATLIVLIPGAVAVAWWHYLPDHLVTKAEKALAADDLATAEALLQQANRQTPDSVRARFLYAQVLRRLKRPAEAQASLLMAMKLGLPEAAGRREFALAEVVKGFTPNAEANLERVLQENPDDAEIFHALAEGYTQNQRWPEADRYYTRLVELHPERIDFLLERGHARLSAVGFHKGRVADAAADFREILRHSPDHYEARLYLAHCLLSDARMPEAKQELLRCRQLAPQHVEPLVGLAACAVEDRAWEEAETILRQALELDPQSAYVRGMLGDLHLRQQHFDRAIPFFQQALDLEPQNKAIRLKLAQALRYTGQQEKAKEQERIYRELMEQKDPAR
jgi:cytochrome c-type biogenesis protein CcmH/NrfG